MSFTPEITATVHPSPVQGRITAPASKSYAQRALAAALLVERGLGSSRLQSMSLCNDTEAVLGVIQKLGATVTADGTAYTVTGGNFLKAVAPLEITIGESGLATRLFVPIAALAPEPVTITGHGSILNRPIAEVAEPLQEMGIALTWGNPGKHTLPLTVRGPLRGGGYRIDGSGGSQFVSGLLMALPLAAESSLLRVANLKSTPYVGMTLEVLRAFDITVEKNEDYSEFRIPGAQRYRAADYAVEGDWSGASCLLVAGAIAGSVTVGGLNPHSLQADRAITGVLQQAGAVIEWNGDALTVGVPPEGLLRAFEFDATDCPDLFPALAALAIRCEGRSAIRGTSRLTNKESDRAAVIREELSKFGAKIDNDSQPGTMLITGQPSGALNPCPGTSASGTAQPFDSHNDHRIAMAVATLALLARQPVEICGAQAVAKSYPGFWDDLAKISIQK